MRGGWMPSIQIQAQETRRRKGKREGENTDIRGGKKVKVKQLLTIYSSMECAKNVPGYLY